MMQVVFVVLHKTELLQDLLTKLKCSQFNICISILYSPSCGSKGAVSRNDFLYSRK